MPGTESSQFELRTVHEVDFEANWCRVQLDGKPETGVFLNDQIEFLPVCLVSVHVKGDEHERIRGCAFWIAPGVAVTASHVLDGLDINIVSLIDNLAQFGQKQRWAVLSKVQLPGSDMMILACKYAQDTRVSPTAVQTGMVACRKASLKIGDEVLIVASVVAGDDGYKIGYAKGEVDDIQRKTSDQSSVPEIHYLVSAATLGTMSGGLAFDSSGLCVGFISMGMNFDDGKGYTRVVDIDVVLGGRTRSLFVPEKEGEPILVTELPGLSVV